MKVRYRQTERIEIYKQYVDRLIKEGKAYYCYCTPEELEARRKEAMKLGKPVKYDRRCLRRNEPVPDIKPAVRFKMPDYGQTVVKDMVRGTVVFDNEQLDDLIIMRSDGTPTYNLTVVVDDIDMGITHVIRGDDHLNNTPKQIQLYNAFGYETPVFAHLPMILGSDKTRLSKRHGATSVMAYRDMGYLPDALVNYIARLGWSYGDQEIFSREELIRYFSFDNVGKSAAVFNPEKLLWLNAQYIMKSDLDSLCDMVIPFLKRDGIITDEDSINREWLKKAIKTLQERAKTLVELAHSLRYYIAEHVEYDEKAKTKFLNKESLPLLKELTERLNGMDSFTESSIEELFRSIVEAHGVKLGKLAQPVRVALTGVSASPGIFELMDVMGKEKVMSRLKRAVDIIEQEA